jgi:hypothetical protein
MVCEEWHNRGKHPGASKHHTGLPKPCLSLDTHWSKGFSLKKGNEPPRLCRNDPGYPESVVKGMRSVTRYLRRIYSERDLGPHLKQNTRSQLKRTPRKIAPFEGDDVSLFNPSFVKKDARGEFIGPLDRIIHMRLDFWGPISYARPTKARRDLRKTRQITRGQSS